MMGNQFTCRNHPTVPATAAAKIHCTSHSRHIGARANAATPRGVSGCQAGASVSSGIITRTRKSSRDDFNRRTGFVAGRKWEPGVSDLLLIPNLISYGLGLLAGRALRTRRL